MMRPLMKGPRSVMETIAVRPLLRLVTRTLVPKRRVRWAAVAPESLNFLPEAVAVPPLVFTEYQDIFPRWVDFTTYLPAISLGFGLGLEGGNAGFACGETGRVGAAFSLPSSLCEVERSAQPVREKRSEKIMILRMIRAGYHFFWLAKSFQGADQMRATNSG